MRVCLRASACVSFVCACCLRDVFCLLLRVVRGEEGEGGVGSGFFVRASVHSDVASGSFDVGSSFRPERLLDCISLCE